MPAEEKTFPESYVKEIREEAKANRKRAEVYERAFKGYDPEERDYLLRSIETMATDQVAGAEEFRHIAKEMMGDKFYEGLELPVGDESNEQEGQMPEGTEETAAAAGLTEERLIEILDARESARLEAEQKENDTAAEAEIEAIYTEIESLGAGYERGSLGFQQALLLAQQDENFTTFEALKPQIDKVVSVLSPEAEGSEGAEGAESAEGGEAASEAKPEHPKTAGAAGSAGVAAGDKPGDWVKEAKEEGKDLAAEAQSRFVARMNEAGGLN